MTPQQWEALARKLGHDPKALQEAVTLPRAYVDALIRKDDIQPILNHARTLKD